MSHRRPVQPRFNLVPRRRLTGYSNDELKQIFGGIAVAAPICAAYFYVRVYVVEPLLQERRKTPEMAETKVETKVEKKVENEAEKS